MKQSMYRSSTQKHTWGLLNNILLGIHHTGFPVEKITLLFPSENKLFFVMMSLMP